MWYTLSSEERDENEMRAAITIAILAGAGTAFVVGLLYGIDALSIILAPYFNDHAAIQFLNWMYRV